MLDSKRDDVAPRPGKPGAARTGGRNPTRRAGGHKQESKGSTEGDRPPVYWARWAAPLRDFHDTSEAVREGSYGRRA
eukprot:scaffold81891_cov33-Phaeocystis_antarctica.AAC.1